MYGSTGLYLTKDGGQHWTKAAGQADAIEPGNGTVIRVSHDMQDCPPGCTFQISTAPVGSVDWHTVQVPSDSMIGNYVQLVRTGKLAFVQIHANPAGGAEDAHTRLLESTDSGQTWTDHQDPCGTHGGVEADSAQMATGDDGSLSILCAPRTGGSDFVITSLDGGAHFSTQRDVTTGQLDAGRDRAGTRPAHQRAHLDRLSESESGPLGHRYPRAAEHGRRWRELGDVHV